MKHFFSIIIFTFLIGIQLNAQLKNNIGISYSYGIQSYYNSNFSIGFNSSRTYVSNYGIRYLYLLNHTLATRIGIEYCKQVFDYNSIWGNIEETSTDDVSSTITQLIQIPLGIRLKYGSLFFTDVGISVCKNSVRIIPSSLTTKFNNSGFGYGYHMFSGICLKLGKNINLSTGPFLNGYRIQLANNQADENLLMWGLRLESAYIF